MIQDDPEGFAAAVLQLWSQPALYATLRKNARQRVEQLYDWQPILERMDAELVSFAQGAQPH